MKGYVKQNAPTGEPAGAIANTASDRPAPEERPAASETDYFIRTTCTDFSSPD